MLRMVNKPLLHLFVDRSISCIHTLQVHGHTHTISISLDSSVVLYHAQYSFFLSLFAFKTRLACAPVWLLNYTYFNKFIYAFFLLNKTHIFFFQKKKIKNETSFCCFFVLFIIIIIDSYFHVFRYAIGIIEQNVCGCFENRFGLLKMNTCEHT